MYCIIDDVFVSKEERPDDSTVKDDGAIEIGWDHEPDHEYALKIIFVTIKNCCDCKKYVFFYHFLVCLRFYDGIFYYCLRS